MNLEKRITRLFLLRLIILIAVNVVVYLFIIYFAFQFIREPDYDNPREFMQEAAEQTQLVDKQPTINQSIIEEINKSGAWLQILDGTGKEIFQHGKPDGIPIHYSPSELTDYQQGLIKTGYRIHTWYGNMETGTASKQGLTWVYGKPIPSEQLLQQVVQVTDWQEGVVTIPPSKLNQLKDSRAWLQVIDKNGREIYQYNKPKKQPANYTPGQFVYHKTQGSEMQYFTGELGGNEVTWVLGIKRSNMENQFSTFNQVLSLTLTICVLMITLYMAILFGQRMGAPLVHMMNWIGQLGKGQLEEPKDQKGVPFSIDPGTGQLRRPYRMYQDLLSRLKTLTNTLKQNQDERDRLEKTREEWMAGISHDLKTPLSSVKGYANLLADSPYQWSEEEVRHYAQIIQSKGDYIERLIEDLNLTFRLKNEALPLNKQPTDMIELVRRAVIDLVNDPRVQQQEITFHTHSDRLIYPVDEQWLIRALDNLLINAVIHNPPHTKVQVEVGEEEGRIFISIIDDGQGIDQETIHHLFDRYYRGTHTQWQEDGTGLGMAIADQLIQAHGGSIEVESELGKGTKIWIYFHHE